MDPFSTYFAVAALVIAAGFVIYRERAHVKELLTAVGVTDASGNFVTPASASTILPALAIGDATAGIPGPAGPAGADGKDGVMSLPPGTIVIPPTTAQYQAIVNLAPDATTIPA